MAVNPVLAGAALLFGLAATSPACSRADAFAITEDVASPSAGNGGSGGSVGDSGGSGNGGNTSTGGDSGRAGDGNGGGPAGGAAGAGGAPACSLPPLEPGDTEHTVLVHGVRRSYLLHVPASYDGSKSVPLLVDFHGIGESAQGRRESSSYPARVDGEGVIMAFPEGLRGPVGAAWNVGPCCVKDADDVAFARALVAQIRQTHCVDPSRIYATGAWTGGGMAHYLACQAADLFAAVAPSQFDLLEETVDDCVPARPIGVIAFRETTDSRVPYTGGPSALVPGMPLTFLGAEATFEKWAELNRCSGPPSRVNADGCSSYTDCDGGAEVALCTTGGGDGDAPDATIAWPFLARHVLGD